jgi:hypothetical protein
MRLDLNKFDEVRKDIEREKKVPFDLYALLEREEEIGKWDLVLSASWINGVTAENMGYVLRKMKKRLTREEQDMVTHIILLRSNEPVVETILQSSQRIIYPSGIIADGIDRTYINGMLINRGYIMSKNNLFGSNSQSRPIAG